MCVHRSKANVKAIIFFFDHFTLGMNKLLRYVHTSVTVTVTLTGGTFDLLMVTLTGRMGRLHIFSVDVMLVTVTQTESVGVKQPLRFRFKYIIMISSRQLEANFKAIISWTFVVCFFDHFFRFQMVWSATKGLLTPNDSLADTVTLTGGTFNLWREL